MNQKLGALRSIREVATWCESRPLEGGGEALRSPGLEPDRLLLFEMKDETGVPRLLVADDRMASGSVEAVVTKRRHSLGRHERALLEHVSDADGRILSHLPALSLSEGASEDLSLGFFDVDNTPPWDTWLAYLPVGEEGRPTLLSWVPAALMDRVEAGLDVNWERSIRWADATILESPEVQLLLDS